MFTAAQIRRLAPSARADLVDALVAGIPEMEAADITPGLRLEHFLAQLATETGGFHAIDENLSYSAERLMQVWPSRFPSLTVAEQYAHNPQKLANYVYANRNGNGAPATDDGWRFHGRSFIQTTGRENYRSAGHEDDPETLAQPGPGLTAAISYWTEHGLNDLADRDDVVAVRRRINGGTIGLDDAREYLERAETVFGTAVVPTSDGVVVYDAATDNPEVLRAQQALWDKGYTEVGNRDGKFGLRTIGALNRFRVSNGLPIRSDTAITTADWAALARAPAAPVSDERASTTSADLAAQGSATIVGANRSIGSIVAAGVAGGVGTVAKTIADNGDTLANAVSTGRRILEAIGDLWWVVAIPVAGFAILELVKVKRARVKAQRTGLHA